MDVMFRNKVIELNYYVNDTYILIKGDRLLQPTKTVCDVSDTTAILSSVQVFYFANEDAAILTRIYTFHGTVII